MKKPRDTWSTVDPIAWQCGPSWSAKRWCALFPIVFASLVGDNHLVLGSSVHFFDVLLSAQCVDRPVVHVRMAAAGEAKQR